MEIYGGSFGQDRGSEAVLIIWIRIKRSEQNEYYGFSELDDIWM